MVQWLLHDATPYQFHKRMRMDRMAFDKLVDMVHPYVFRQDTNFRAAITVRERVAIALYQLNHGVSGIVTEAVMRRSRSTCTEILHEFCFILSQ